MHSERRSQIVAGLEFKIKSECHLKSSLGNVKFFKLTKLIFGWKMKGKI